MIAARHPKGQTVLSMGTPQPGIHPGLYPGLSPQVQALMQRGPNPANPTPPDGPTGLESMPQMHPNSALPALANAAGQMPYPVAPQPALTNAAGAIPGAMDPGVPQPGQQQPLAAQPGALGPTAAPAPPAPGVPQPMQQPSKFGNANFGGFGAGVNGLMRYYTR